MLRCREPGWIMLAMHDGAGRRGLWMRVGEGKVEFCAGREGDDAYVSVYAGPRLLADFRGVLGYAEEQAPPPPPLPTAAAEWHDICARHAAEWADYRQRHKEEPTK